MATIRDIAEAVGVAPSPVSLAITGDRGVGEATRGRIERAARELGYQRRGPGRPRGGTARRATRPPISASPPRPATSSKPASSRWLPTSRTRP